MNNGVPYNAIKLFEKSYRDALSVLLDAKKCGEISEENYYIMINKMGDRSISLDNDIIKINNVKRFLPILLTIEVGIITIQNFVCFGQYEQLFFFLINGFLMFIILLVLFFFIYKEIKLNENKILKYQFECMSHVCKYKYHLNVI